MNIAHVNLAKGFRGGERQTVLLIDHLSRLEIGMQYLICRGDSPLREHLCHVTNLVFVTADQQWRGHRNMIDVDLVHAHDAKAVHWAWIQKKIHGTPYILTRRIDNPVKDKWFNQLTYRTAKSRVAISNIIKQQLEKKHWGDVVKIPDSFSNFPTHPERTQQLKSAFNGTFIVGHIGALSDHHKGQRVLIDAAERLQHIQPNMQFLFYGAGDDEAVLKKASQHLHNVHWQGFENDIGDVIPMFDVFAFPSRMEGLGSTLLDVMFFNVPIIASNVGGIPDIIKHDQTGLLFENGNVDELVAHLLDLYEHPKRGQCLAHAAKNDVNDFSPECMARRYFDLYRDILTCQR